MACGARLGLKLSWSDSPATTCIRLNGLWSPFGFETRTHYMFHKLLVMAKWPVEPVWV